MQRLAQVVEAQLNRGLRRMAQYRIVVRVLQILHDAWPETAADPRVTRSSHEDAISDVLRWKINNFSAAGKDRSVLTITSACVTTNRVGFQSGEFPGCKFRFSMKRLSNVAQISLVFSYQRIFGTGPEVVPLILAELDKEPDHWFWRCVGQA